jgi:hypothetical protein
MSAIHWYCNDCSWTGDKDEAVDLCPACGYGVTTSPAAEISRELVYGGRIALTATLGGNKVVTVLVGGGRARLMFSGSVLTADYGDSKRRVDLLCKLFKEVDAVLEARERRET